jgi:hypothetical protein
MRLRLWRELHQCDPVQLQLSLKNTAKKNNSAAFREKARVTRMPVVSSKSGIAMGDAKNSLC